MTIQTKHFEGIERDNILGVFKAIGFDIDEVVTPDHRDELADVICTAWDEYTQIGYDFGTAAVKVLDNLFAAVRAQSGGSNA